MHFCCQCRLLIFILFCPFSLYSPYLDCLFNPSILFNFCVLYVAEYFTIASLHSVLHFYFQCICSELDPSATITCLGSGEGPLPLHCHLPVCYRPLVLGVNMKKMMHSKSAVLLNYVFSMTGGHWKEDSTMSRIQDREVFCLFFRSHSEEPCA